MSNTNSFSLTGVMHQKANAIQVSEKFTKREFMINTSEQYPQTVRFQLTNANCELLEKYNVGDTVTVYFNVRGMEYISKKTGEPGQINTLQAFKIQYVASCQHQDAPSSQNVPQNVPSNPIVPKSDELFEDLPF